MQLGKAAGARVIGVVGGRAEGRGGAAARGGRGDRPAHRGRRGGGQGGHRRSRRGRGVRPGRRRRVHAVDQVHRLRGPDRSWWGSRAGRCRRPPSNHALVKNYSILGLHWGLYKAYNQQAIDDCHVELTRLAAEGAIRPLISERLARRGGRRHRQARRREHRRTGRLRPLSLAGSISSLTAGSRFRR